MAKLEESKLPRKEPDETCNKRIYRGGKDVYCDTKADEKRCKKHLPQNKATKEKALEEVDRQAVSERVLELRDDVKNLTELDDEILGLAAIIDDLERNYHRSGWPLERANTIGKLKKIKAEIIEKKINIEFKDRLILNVDSVWEQLKTAIDDVIKDKNLNAQLKDRCARVLDTVVESGSGTSDYR